MNKRRTHRAALAALCLSGVLSATAALAASPAPVEIWHLPAETFDETSHRNASLFYFMNDGTCMSETDNGNGTKDVEVNECQVTVNMIVVGNTIKEDRCRPLNSQLEHRKIPLLRSPGKLIMDLNVKYEIVLEPANKDLVQYFKGLDTCQPEARNLGLQY